MLGARRAPKAVSLKPCSFQLLQDGQNWVQVRAPVLLSLDLNKMFFGTLIAKYTYFLLKKKKKKRGALTDSSA